MDIGASKYEPNARLTPMSSHGSDETLRDITALVAGLSVDKAAVRDRRKLFVVAHVAVDGAPGPAAAGAVVAVAVAVDGAAVWRLQDHLAVVLALPVKAVPAAVSEAQRALGQASQAQVVE